MVIAWSPVGKLIYNFRKLEAKSILSSTEPLYLGSLLSQCATAPVSLNCSHVDSNSRLVWL